MHDKPEIGYDRADAGSKRFFVTIHARDVASLRRLAAFDVDLAYGTARGKGREPTTIEALVTMDEVARLVEAGYPVLVTEEASLRARASREITTFPEWLADWRKDMEK